jgi:hypothetical protein
MGKAFLVREKITYKVGSLGTKPFYYKDGGEEREQRACTQTS